MVKEKYESSSEEERTSFYDTYVELFDGSGIEGWCE